jgi:hypothetical protein
MKRLDNQPNIQSDDLLNIKKASNISLKALVIGQSSKCLNSKWAVFYTSVSTENNQLHIHPKRVTQQSVKGETT